MCARRMMPVASRTRPLHYTAFHGHNCLQYLNVIGDLYAILNEVAFGYIDDVTDAILDCYSHEVR